MITGGSSMPVLSVSAAMIYKALAQFGQRSMSMSKTRLSSRAQLMRAGALCRSRKDFTAQLRIGRQNAMEANQMLARPGHGAASSASATWSGPVQEIIAAYERVP